MPVHGLLQTAVSTNTGVGKNRPVGLLYDRTGVPAFLLGLHGVEAPQSWEVSSLEHAVERMRQFDAVEDRKAFESVLAFFEAQGTDARVVATPVVKTGTIRGKKGGLKHLLGADRGPGRRTGFFLLAEAMQYADLFVMPQSAEYAEGDLTELRGFWDAIAGQMQHLRGPFALLDAPLAASVEQVAQAVKGIDFPDSAIFHSWIQVREAVLPPSCAVAAAIQRTDREAGVHELPANRAGTSGICPIREFTAAELKRCREARIGTFFIDDMGNSRLWCSDTLSASYAASERVMSVRRTVQAVRAAIEQICEPYVMEPVGEELPVHLENRLTNFLHSVRGKLDAETSPPYKVAVKLADNSGDPGLDVSVQLALPRALEHISLEMNLCA